MIFDLLANQALYRSVHPGFAASFDWLSKFDPSLADGKYPIDGDRVFALVQSYTTGLPSQKKFETHVEHIDIQYVAQGVETMPVVARGGLVATLPYEAARDVELYADPSEWTTLLCGPGSFAIYFPHDAHKPGCISGAPMLIKKVVIKVKVA